MPAPLRTPTGRRDPLLSPALLMLLVLALDVGGAGFMVWLHLAEGSHEQGEPSFAVHWLRDAGLALPAVLLAVLLAARLTTRLASRLGLRRAAHGRLLAASAAVASAVAFTVGNPVHEALFGAHEVHEMALAVHLVRDGVVALAVTLPLSAIVLGSAGLLRRLRATRWSLAASRRPVARLAVLSLLGSTLALAAGAPASAAPSQVDPGPGAPCPAAAPPRTFDVTARDVKIPLNRFGDNDPQGKMFVATSTSYYGVTTPNAYRLDTDTGIPVADAAGPLSALEAVALQESSQKVSIGLRDDPIQPLSIRANQGDCVTINFTNNASGDTFGLHIDGLSFTSGSSGDSIGDNVNSTVPNTAGSNKRTYVYYVPKERTLEGSHYLHPGPGERFAVDHGLFGMLTVEPEGARYLDANTGLPLVAGWEATIAPTAASNATVFPKAFREAVKMHHEVGNDNEKIYDRNGTALPQVDSTTGSYRPGEFALNYRSEPFRNRLLSYGKEKSHAYSSYTFGDPSTPMPRGYVGDPTKFRISHASGEKFHVYHLHGGGDRWRFNPVADPSWNYADTALDKHPQNEVASNRLDAQSIGPGESYNLELEGGAGGVQHTVGDLLFHCHISKHYVSGMWSFWRVYNTVQPNFAPLPDRDTPSTGRPASGVDSSYFLGKTVNGQLLDTHAAVDAWVRQQLPPQGVKTAQDPSVLDWKFASAAGDVALGEREDLTTRAVWPNQSDVPGHPGLLLGDDLSKMQEGRPAILFNPDDGRLAYPLLRTHVGTRPPFSPNGHSGSPFLGERGDAAIGTQHADPNDAAPVTSFADSPTVDPYARRADGLCPSTQKDGSPTPVRHFNVVAIDKVLQRSKTVSDPEGKLFVLAQEKDRALADPAYNDPLALRTNVGDCDKVTLSNEMTDAGAFDGHSKTSMHIHHVQFDVQGSDGVSTGYAYEHSVRPYKVEDTTLTAAAAAGGRSIEVADVRKFATTTADGVASKPFVGIGMGTDGIEVTRVVGVTAAAADPLTGRVPGSLSLDAPLLRAHSSGQAAGFEFIQYQWYADTELDNIFWHDHVDGIHGWGHGLVGQLIVEPAGSTYLDPKDHRKQLASGPIADIVVDKLARNYQALAPGRVDGSFREVALWTINDNDQGAYSTVNLKAAPFSERPDPANRFSSYRYGDPNTPLPQAYAGDDVVVRTLNVGPSLDTLRFAGPRFVVDNRFTVDGSGTVQGDPGKGTAGIGSLADTVHYGISEKFTLILQGNASAAGDYLYFNGDARRTRDGAWGIVRVLDKSTPSDLEPLTATAPTGAVWSTPPGSSPPAVTSPGRPCPSTSPVHAFAVSAVDAGGQAVFVPSGAQAAAVKAGTTKPEPLVLHVAAGECVKVSLTNGRAVPVSFSVGKLLRNADSAGVNVGYGPEANTPAGATRDYYYFADTDRIGTAVLADMAGEDSHKAGLYGAVVVSPPGATFTHPVTAARVDIGTAVDVHVPASSPTASDRQDYRDFALLLADDDPKMSQDFMPYPTNATLGKTVFNYKTSPPGDSTASYQSYNPALDLTAYAGDPMLVHEIVAPGSEQGHVFNLGGLSARRDMFLPGSEETQNQAVGPWENFDAKILGGAGGRNAMVGDFYYGDMRRPFNQNGVWGITRVLPRPANCAGVVAGGISCLNPPSPTSAAPVQRFLAPDRVTVASPLASSTIPVQVSLSGIGQVGSYDVEVQKTTGSTVGPWTPVASTTSDAPSVRTDLTLGTLLAPNRYQFRSRACNINGCSAFTNGPLFTLLPVDDTVTALLGYSGSWTTQPVAGAYGGSVRFATAPGPRAALNKIAYSISGNASLITTLGPDRGLLSYSVDGGPGMTMSTWASTLKPAQVLLNLDLSAGTHTVTVTVLGQKDPANPCTITGCGTRVDVDAFAVIK